MTANSPSPATNAERAFRGRSLWTAYTRIETPLGPLDAVATPTGLAGLWFVAQRHHPGAIDLAMAPQTPLFERLRAALSSYWTGQSTNFDLPLDLHGTAFQQAVWAQLMRIPSGATSTYGALAGGLGAPEASRAVGAAVGRNPVSIIVPCHRVIGRDGSLTGYAGGLDRKTALLRLEGALTETLL